MKRVLRSGKAKVEERLPFLVRITGPWILTREDLQDLGMAMEEAWEELTSLAIEQGVMQPRDYDAKRLIAASSSVEDAREKIAKAVTEKRSRECSVTADAKVATAESIADLLHDRGLKDLRPRSLSVEMNAGDLKLEVEIGDEVSLNAGFSPPPALDALRADLADWFRSKRQPAWVRLWCGALPFAAPAVWWFAFWMGARMAKLGERVVRDTLASDANRLLEGGIADDELRPALEILLKKSFGMVPPTTESVPAAPWFTAFVIGISVIATAMLIHPRSCIGLGRGAAACRRWHQWIRVVGYGVPGYLLLQLIVPWLFGEFIGSGQK